MKVCIYLDRGVSFGFSTVAPFLRRTRDGAACVALSGKGSDVPPLLLPAPDLDPADFVSSSTLAPGEVALEGCPFTILAAPRKVNARMLAAHSVAFAQCNRARGLLQIPVSIESGGRLRRVTACRAMDSRTAGGKLGKLALAYFSQLGGEYGTIIAMHFHPGLVVAGGCAGLSVGSGAALENLKWLGGYARRVAKLLPQTPYQSLRLEVQGVSLSPLDIKRIGAVFGPPWSDAAVQAGVRS